MSKCCGQARKASSLLVPLSHRREARYQQLWFESRAGHLSALPKPSLPSLHCSSSVPLAQSCCWLQTRLNSMQVLSSRHWNFAGHTARGGEAASNYMHRMPWLPCLALNCQLHLRSASALWNCFVLPGLCADPGYPHQNLPCLPCSHPTGLHPG